jgi:HTH-type transcriptional regulator, sugar sensing transcriptional regulator
MDFIESKNKLISLGLTERQATVYVRALELGTFSVSDLAKKAGVKRPTCYLVLDELSQKGLVSIVAGPKKIKYRAESPEILKKQAETQMNIAERLSGDLLKIFNPKTEGPTLRYFSGQKAIQGIFDEVLKVKEKEYLFIGSGKDVIDMIGKDYIDEWLKQRIEKGITAKSIRMKKTEVEEDIYQTNINRDLKIAPENIHIAETIFIYDNKVAIISTAQENFGFVVENKEFSGTMRGLFSALWIVSEIKK